MKVFIRAGHILSPSLRPLANGRATELCPALPETFLSLQGDLTSLAVKYESNAPNDFDKEYVSLDQSILKLRLFTYFLLDKNFWWFLSAVLSKMTLPNKSNSKNENRNEFISHFVDILG